MSTFRRRLLMAMPSGGGGGHNLPPEYQEVEWIKSYGYAYFDLEFPSTSTMGMKTQMQRTEQLSQVAYFAGNIGFAFEMTGSTKTIKVFYGNGNTKDLRVMENRGDMFDISLNYMNDGLAISGDSSIDYSPGANSLNLLLLSIRISGSDIRGVEGGTCMWFFEVTDEDELIHAYYPCYRKSDNEPGIYDTIEGKFLTNANSIGYFVVGNPV